MELSQAIDALKKITKQSVALDESLHIDLTLVSASQRQFYEDALKIVYKNIKEGTTTREEIISKILK